MANTRLLIQKKIYKIYKKGKKKITINYALKWRKIKKKKTQNNPPSIPAAAVASRPSLSPPLITNLFSLPEPDELLRLSPL